MSKERSVAAINHGAKVEVEKKNPQRPWKRDQKGKAAGGVAAAVEE